MKITVIGLGKLGLPLAVQFASKNNFVVGLDVDFHRVNTINLGQTPIDEELDLDWKLKEVVSSGHLKAITDPKNAIADAEIIVVTVPLITNEDGDPDYSIIDSVTESIGNYIKKGTLVCYETTVPIGTTRNRFGKKIQELSRFEIGSEVFVVFSPERVLTGRVFSDLRKYPKIVGGVTENCAVNGIKFYTAVLDFDKRTDLKSENGVWNVENSETAEFVKLAETTYRDVNIALANQFAIHAYQLGVNISTVISACNSQLFSHIHNPGISVGGHCIPVYPNLYLYTHTDASLIREARKINKSMPQFYVELLLNFAKNLRHKNVLVMGITYRPGVKEVINSGAFEIDKALKSFGAIPKFSDPLLSEVEITDLNLASGSLNNDTDFVIIHTGYSEYASINYSNYLNLKCIIDGRGILGKEIVNVRNSEF